MSKRCVKLIVKLYYLFNKVLTINYFLLNNYKKNIINVIVYNLFKSFIACIIVKQTYYYITLNNNNNNLNLVKFFKYFILFNCEQLLDLVIIDKLEMKLYDKKRFHYIYVILSVIYNIRIFISGFLFIFESLFSLVNLYNSAD